MSVYRRFISYMYDHLQNAKGKNCGFVKIEIKNSKCTISFQLKHAPCLETCNVYLYCPTESTPFLFAGSVPIQKGNTNQKLTLDALHMANSAIPFSKCAGLLCTDEKGNDCCTCWTDQVTMPVYEPKKENTPIAEESVAEDVLDCDDADSDDSVDSTLTDPSAESMPTAKPQSEESPVPSPPRPFSDIWAHLQKELPPLDPFEDDAIVETIKITPSDLGYLQCFKSDLSANQFLLHGYKNYHHLLLGRIHGQMQYILGVPGVFDPQEQFMAKMFGFPCFKPIRECRKKNGQFGYWMRCFR